MLRNGVLRYIRHKCPKLQCNMCSKCYGMDCFGTYFTHVQSCNVTCVQSATEWTASVHTSHMPQAVMYNPCSKCYGMDCFGTYFTRVQTCNVTRVQSATAWTACTNTYFTHVQSCNVTRVQSATEWTALVHTSHMSKAVM